MQAHQRQKYHPPPHAVDPALITAVHGYASEAHHGPDHVDRWNRVLAAFGVAQHDSIMTAQEAQAYADRGWKRWIPVVEALSAIEKAQQPEAEPQQPTQEYAEIITAVQSYAAETHHGPDHVDRWNRVLAAFGVAQHDSIMTAAEASQMAEKYQKARWAPVAEALAQIESEAAAQQEAEPTPQQAPQDIQSEQQEPPIWPESAQQDDLGPVQNSHEPYQVPQSLITTVQGYAAETQNGAEHVDRWNRVLAAFGVAQHDSIMTAAEAQGFADRFSSARWDPIVAALTALEESQQPHGMTRAEVIAEWGPKVQKMREMSAQANSMVNEAKEFVKKWDETPARYADAIDNAEHDLEFLEIRLVDNAYEQLKDNPTSTVHRETLHGLYESMQDNFRSLETHLELILNTARQPSTKEMCNRDNVECEWHDGPASVTAKSMTFTYPSDADTGKVTIEQYESGEIKRYTDYYADDPTKRKVDILYRNPHEVIENPGGIPSILLPVGETKFINDTKVSYSWDTTVTYARNATVTYNENTPVTYFKNTKLTYYHDTRVEYNKQIDLTYGNGSKASFLKSKAYEHPAGTTIIKSSAGYTVTYLDETMMAYENDTTVTYSKYGHNPDSAMTYSEGTVISLSVYDRGMNILQDKLELWYENFRAKQSSESAYYINGQLAHNVLYYSPYYEDLQRVRDDVYRSDGTPIYEFGYYEISGGLITGIIYYQDGSEKWKDESGVITCYTNAGAAETCTAEHKRYEY